MADDRPASGERDSEADSGPGDDARRKFREALDKKREQQHASESALERDGSEKSHGVGNSTKSRTFRRKTG